jgi:hypothetical protein
VQARRGALVHHVEHVGLHPGELAQQRGQAAGQIGKQHLEGQVAALCRHPVTDHPHQQQRVDVPAGQHDDGGRLEPVRVLQQRGHGGRPRRFDDQLGPLQEHQERPRQ